MRVREQERSGGAEGAGDGLVPERVEAFEHAASAEKTDYERA